MALTRRGTRRRTGARFVSFLLPLTAMLSFHGLAQAKPLSVKGATGYLSEWEIKGDISEISSSPAGLFTKESKEFSGTLTLTHAGLCSVNGPEVKPADIKLSMSGSRNASRINGTLTLDGAACAFSGTFSDSFSGFMDCSNAKGIPVKLTLQ